MNFSYPVLDRDTISSHFGWRMINGKKEFHNGIDFAVPRGTSVLASDAGTVAAVYNDNTGGKQLIIDHPGGFRSGYAHLDGFAVKQGEQVAKGEIIGWSGDTGKTTGPNLHFTITDRKGVKVDPAWYLKKKALVLWGAGFAIVFLIVLIILFLRLRNKKTKP